MRKNICIASLALGLFSCTSSVDIPVRKGSLVIGDLAREDGEVVAVATRAVDEGLALEIVDEDGQAVMSFAPGAPAVSEKIELAPGGYVLRAFSPNLDDAYADGDLGEAKYDGAVNFSIAEEHTTYVSLRTPMVNASVVLILPEGFESWFSGGYEFSLSLGGRSVSLRDGESAYFDIGDAQEASYSLHATNSDGETFSKDGVFTAVPGLSYELRFDLLPQGE